MSVRRSRCRIDGCGCSRSRTDWRPPRRAWRSPAIAFASAVLGSQATLLVLDWMGVA